MISYTQALSLVMGQSINLGEEFVPLPHLVGRICAEKITAPSSIQAFDNSAMDGFAVLANDLGAASPKSPRTLAITARIAAGPINTNLQLAPGQCMEIMTGAAIPKSCDAVVPIEHVSVQDGKVVFHEPTRREANIRRAGEDFKHGDLLLSLGDTIQPHHILVLASFGIEKIKVMRKIKIGCISTGNEVINDFSKELTYGEIYDSTGPYLHQALQQYGAEIRHYGGQPDNSASLKTVIEQMLADGCQIIVSTGGVSAGRYDFVRKTLEDMQAEVLFHKTAIRPGKPILFAKLGSGSLFFGLPGNPLSTVCGFYFFILPLLRSLNQQTQIAPQRCVTQNSFAKKNDFRWFLLGKVTTSEDGMLKVEIIPKQQSFMVSPLLQANAWIVLPEASDGVVNGDLIDVFWL